MKRTYRIWQGGSNWWHVEPIIYKGTLLGAKQYASRHCLEYGMNVSICDENDRPICRRRFWNSLSTFGWHNWEHC